MLYGMLLKRKSLKNLRDSRMGTKEERGNNIYDKAPQIRITFLREPKVGKID